MLVGKFVGQYFDGFMRDVVLFISGLKKGI